MMRKTAWGVFSFLFVFICLAVNTPDAEARHRRHKRTPTEETAANAVLTPAPADSPLVIDRVDGNTLTFKTTDGSPAPKPLTLDSLFEIQPIGVLRAAAGGQPYFILRARPCKSCRQEPGIFIVQATGGKPSRFVEPGRILDNRSRAVVMESRAFYGRCLAGRPGDVYVVFQREKVDRKRQPQQSVLVAEPTVETVENGKLFDHLHEYLMERHIPRINTTLHLVKSKACQELDGRHRVMANRPPDVNLKRQKAIDNDDDDDDGNAPRENQSDRDFEGAVPASD